VKIDTEPTRRLRDALLEVGLAGEAATPEGVGSPDPLTVAQQATLERVLPMIETLYLMMVADRETSQEESATLRGAVATLTGERLNDKVLAWMLGTFEKRLSEQGREARLDQIGAQLSADPADAEMAFSLAAAVALADGRVDSEEGRLVDELAKFFGISSQRSASLLGDVTDA
jgi:hypothetical protein